MQATPATRIAELLERVADRGRLVVMLPDELADQRRHVMRLRSLFALTGAEARTLVQLMQDEQATKEELHNAMSDSAPTTATTTSLWLSTSCGESFGLTASRSLTSTGSDICSLQTVAPKSRSFSTSTTIRSSPKVAANFGGESCNVARAELNETIIVPVCVSPLAHRILQPPIGAFVHFDFPSVKIHRSRLTRVTKGDFLARRSTFTSPNRSSSSKERHFARRAQFSHRGNDRIRFGHFEVKGYDALMELYYVHPDKLLGDKGYDSDEIRDDLAERGIDHAAYKRCNLTERCVNRLKQFRLRRIAARYEKTASCFVDDVEELEHVRTPEARAKTLSWFMTELMPALDKGARTRVTATPRDRIGRGTRRRSKSRCK